MEACRTEAPVVEVRSVVPKAVFAPCLAASAVAGAAKEAQRRAPARTGGAVKRVLREYDAVCKAAPEGWRIFVSADNVLRWKAVLDGLPAPYDDGAWLLTIEFPDNYPFSPPRVRFVTPTFHCNVSVDGMICLDVLQHGWSPAQGIAAVLGAVHELMRAPDAMTPLDAYKGALYRDDRASYEREATKHTREHAGKDFLTLATKFNLAADVPDAAHAA